MKMDEFDRSLETRINQYNFLMDAYDIMTANEQRWLWNLGSQIRLGGLTITNRQLEVWNNLYSKVKKRWDDTHSQNNPK
jgi:hypothetical protein